MIPGTSNPAMMGSVGGVPFSMYVAGSGTSTSASPTFTSLAVPNPSDNRYIIASISARDNLSDTTFTIAVTMAGSSATEIYENRSGANGHTTFAGFWYIPLTTGTTCTVSVSLTGFSGAMVRWVCQLYEVEGVDFDNISTSSGTTNVTIDPTGFESVLLQAADENGGVGNWSGGNVQDAEEDDGFCAAGFDDNPPSTSTAYNYGSFNHNHAAIALPADAAPLPGLTATTTAESTYATTSTTQTHSSLSLGTAFTGRVLLILGSFDGNSNTLSTTGCTVAGNSATKIIEKTQGSGSNASVASVYLMKLDTGTTGDVVFSIGGGGSSRGSRCAVISLDGLQSTTAVDTNSAGGSTSTLTCSNVDAPVGGIQVAVAAANSGGTSITFSNITEFGDGAFGAESARYGMASDELIAGKYRDIACTWGSAPARGALAVATFR